MSNASAVVEHKLDNGMKILLIEMHTAPVVSVWTWYRVGSRNEYPGITGISHWVEHLQFKGTANIPEGEIFKSISRCGGRDNAFTMEDFTTYFETLPSTDLELALKIEGDRMANSLFTPEVVESERSVIISEIEGYENFPNNRLYNEVRATAFTAHPYRWEIAGYKCDVEKMTRDDLYGHYKKFYAPDNATLVIAGDFDPEKALELARKYFGCHKPSGLKNEVRTQEPPQVGERRTQVRLPGNASHWMAVWHTPQFIHEDTPALIVLDAVLSGAKPISLMGGGFMGKSARLYHLLVNKRALAVSASSSMDTTIDPGLFTIHLVLRDGADPNKVEQAVLGEIEKLRKDGPTPKELAKAVRQARAQVEYSRDGVTSRAFVEGYFEMLGDRKFVDELPTRLEKITIEDVKKVVGKYFKETNRTIGVFLPESPGAGGVPAEAMSQFSRARFVQRGQVRDIEMPRFPKVYEYLFDNGVRLLGVEVMEARAMSVAGFLHAGSIFDPPGKEGLAYLTQTYLSEGTKSKDAQRFAEAFESLGATLSFSGGKDSCTFNITCLPDDTQKMLSMLKESLTEMAAPAAEFAKVRQKVITSLKTDRDNTQYMAALAALEALYGRQHPYHRDSRGTEESLLSMTREDVLKFSREFYLPKNLTIVMAGPMRFADMSSMIHKMFAMWIDDRQAVPPPLTPPVKAASPGEKLLVLPGKSQCDLFISFPGAMPSDRDYHPLLVANSILGQFGLMGRLGDVVRDKMGLAYYAASQLSPRLHGGEINIYAGVNPKNARKAIEVIKKEVERFRSKMVDEKELSDSKGNILGGLPLGLETGAAICRQLLSIAMHQLPLDYFQRYYQDVHNITRERVLEIANHYLSTEPVIAVAGPEIPKA